MPSFEDVYCCHKQLPNLKLSKQDLDRFGPVIERVAKKAFRQFMHVWRPAAFDYQDLYNIGLIHLTIFCNKYIDRTLDKDKLNGTAGAHVRQKLRSLAKRVNMKLHCTKLKMVVNKEEDDQLNHLENIAHEAGEPIDGDYIIETKGVTIPITLNRTSKGLVARHKDSILDQGRVEKILKSVADGKATIERCVVEKPVKPLKELRKRWANLPKKQKQTLLHEMVEVDGFASEEAAKALGYIEAGNIREGVRDSEEYKEMHQKVKETCLEKAPKTYVCKKCGVEDETSKFGLRVSHDKVTGFPKVAWVQCYCPKCRNA